MKAILIVDMPKSCGECPLRTSLEANYLYCIATLPRLKIDPMTAQIIKEHKCPLKPMPEKKETLDGIEFEIVGNTMWENTSLSYALGWNACLDAITGETE